MTYIPSNRIIQIALVIVSIILALAIWINLVSPVLEFADRAMNADAAQIAQCEEIFGACGGSN